LRTGLRPEPRQARPLALPLTLIIKYKPMSQTPDGGGFKISSKTASYLLANDLLKNAEIVCYEYGKDNCDECEGECEHWNGVYKDDLNEDNEFDSDYINFEIWPNSPTPTKPLNLTEANDIRKAVNILLKKLS